MTTQPETAIAAKNGMLVETKNSKPCREEAAEQKNLKETRSAHQDIFHAKALMALSSVTIEVKLRPARSFTIAALCMAAF
ncbi:MAG: hypothetical protein AAFV45_00015 [Pseudomonadota bacterium]